MAFGLSKIRMFAGVYSLFVGLSMILMWMALYIGGSISEVGNEPMGIGMHIAAEILTGILLITGAYGLLGNKKWAFNVYLISLGMLMYTLIASPGYYADKGDIVFVGMFTILLIPAVAFVVLSFARKEEFTNFNR